MAIEVALARCDSYDREVVERALNEVLSPIGGLDWVRPGMKVAIKANLVAAMKPDTAAAVHPVLAAALTRQLVERGAEVTLGDSPGGIYSSMYVNHVYAQTGMGMIEEAGGRLNQDFSEADKDVADPIVARRIHYTAWLNHADAVIDLCKLKTHAMMGMTCAAKNMFGVIPGTYKPEYHCRYADTMDFARMLLDLDRSFPIRLCLVDAVIGMEGNGPTAGKPRRIGCLLAAAEPHKLDLVCSRLISLTPRQVPTLIAAQEQGWIPKEASQVITNIPFEPFCVQDYVTLRAAGETALRGADVLWGKTANRLLSKMIGSRPKVHSDGCIGCGKCAEVCPAKAITLRDRLPKIDRRKCIRCFCCQEFCPGGAMQVHRPLAARFFGRL